MYHRLLPTVRGLTDFIPLTSTKMTLELLAETFGCHLAQSCASDYISCVHSSLHMLATIDCSQTKDLKKVLCLFAL